MSVLVGTDLLVEYLRGSSSASRAIEAYEHRSITALTWLSAMAIAPQEQLEATRAFLRSFERLSINEAIADEALQLIHGQPGLDLHEALNRATASINRLEYLHSSLSQATQHNGLNPTP